MSSEFYNLDDTSRFPMGPLKVDVPSLYRRIPVKKDKKAKPKFRRDFFHRYIYQSRILSLAFRVKLRTFLRKTGIDDLWVKYFQEYWVLLGGRPLWHSSDFFFLRNFYRIRQKSPQRNTIKSVEEHLADWQEPQYLYSLFQAVLIETFYSQYYVIQILKAIQPTFGSALEFGSGAAPITTSLFEFGCHPKNVVFYIADLPTLTFHYATYKFRKTSNVIPIILLPENNFMLSTDQRFDVVFCLQVFEHLNDPLTTIKILHQALNTNGVLFFDYIKSDAQGLDTVQGLEERNAVLDFIANNFTIEFGKINKEENMSLTVGRKGGLS